MRTAHGAQSPRIVYIPNLAGNCISPPSPSADGRVDWPDTRGAAALAAIPSALPMNPLDAAAGTAAPAAGGHAPRIGPEDASAPPSMAGTPGALDVQHAAHLAAAHAYMMAGGRPSSGGEDELIKEQDRVLPIANVSRIMKNAVPPNAKIAKDAKETVQECVSEFIAFVTSEAGERCQQEKRKTINGEDIVWAMEALGFDQYAQLMKLYLQKYKEVTKVDKASDYPTYDPHGGVYH